MTCRWAQEAVSPVPSPGLFNGAIIGRRLMMTQQEIEKLQREAEIELKKYPGVVGVDFGFKEIAGETTDQLALIVNVVEKKEKSELDPTEIIPAEFKGVPTDVIKVPKIKPLHCEDMQHHSPLVGGISVTNFIVGPTNSPAVGTLGFFATIDGVPGPENVALISNNHVLMAFGAKVGDTIYQPKHVEEDGKVKLTGDVRERYPSGKTHNAGQEGHHSYQYQGGTTAQYYLDCASAKIDISISSWCNTNCGVSFKNEIRGLNINGNSAIADVARVQQADLPPQPGVEYVVYKVGRTTGKTKGKVVSVTALGDGGEKNMIKIEATQKDCNGILQFAAEGDSGSALINEENKLVGLIFAKNLANPKQAFACHIHPVLDKLSVTPITAANPHSAASTVSNLPGVITEGEFNHTTLLREKFLRTNKGHELYHHILAHRFEVVDLVNHRRPVTVAWHRNKGPAFLSHLINNARDPAHLVPYEIEGVDRETLLRNMAQALSTYGSAGLKVMVDRYHDEVLSYVDQFENLHELVEQLDLEHQYE